MTDGLARTGSPRKAGPETRRELLERLGAPLGAVTVARRPTPEGDVLVVRMTTAGAVPPERRPDRFQGFPVEYETVRPLRIGAA